MKSGPIRPLAENSFLDSRSFSGARATGCVCGGEKVPGAQARL